MNKFSAYTRNLNEALELISDSDICELEADLINLWEKRGKLFICGNGGSGGNAIHLANDFIFGAGYPHRYGLDVEALSANPAVITCLANDIGYENVFSYQLNSKAKKGDILIVLSGSGNSKNITEALSTAKSLGVKTYSFLGFTGGLAKQMSDKPIYIPCNDMQICEDVQLVIGHHLVQALNNHARQNKLDTPKLAVKKLRAA